MNNMENFREFIDRAFNTNIDLTYGMLYDNSIMANLYCIVYNTVNSEIRECEVSYTLYDQVVSISVEIDGRRIHIATEYLTNKVIPMEYNEYMIYLDYSLAVREIAKDLRSRFDNYLKFLEG